MPMVNYSLPNSHPDKHLDLTERQLLQSVVEIARCVFKAAASSVFLIDGTSGELVFEAVSGQGEVQLPGTRFRRGTGIAGWVASSGQPMLVDDLASNPTFDTAAAAATGYVPDSIMAVPLLRDGDCIGVLEVLDPDPSVRDALSDLDLLALLATQAAISLDLLARVQRDRAERGRGVGADLIDRIGEGLRSADATTATASLALLRAADELLAPGR